MRQVDRAISGALLLAMWHSASLLHGDYWIPSPAATVQRLASDVANGVLVRHLSVTSIEAVLGLLIGVVPAVLLPLAFYGRPAAFAVLDPFVDAGYGLPKLTLTPVLMLWLGLEVAPKVALVALSTFFVVYVNVAAGVRGLEANLVRAVRVFGAGPRDVIRHVVLPGAAAFTLAGLRVATPYAVGAAVIAELLSANRGIGYLIQFRASTFDTTGTFAALIAVALISMSAVALIGSLERRFSPCCRSERALDRVG